MGQRLNFIYLSHINIILHARYFGRFIDMLESSGIPHDNWSMIMNRNVLQNVVETFSENQSDIRILAIICFLMKDLPICFTDIHLLYFRRNLTLALYENSSIL